MNLTKYVYIYTPLGSGRRRILGGRHTVGVVAAVIAGVHRGRRQHGAVQDSPPRCRVPRPLKDHRRVIDPEGPVDPSIAPGI